MSTIRATGNYELVDRPPLAKRMGDRYLIIIAILLLGYALDGRGFAYIGFPPIFVGEMTMAFGMIVLLSTPRWVRIFQTSQALILIPFLVWGACRTIPFIAVYDIDALRDAVTWAYAIFAFYMAAVLLAEPARLETLLLWYNKFAKIFVATMPFVWVLVHFIGEGLPNWPWGNSAIISMKEGDCLVHLAGILAFWACGLGPQVSWRWMVLLTVDLALGGVIDRGGLIAFLAVLGVLMCLRPRALAPWRLFMMIFVCMLALAITGIEIELPAGGKNRALSFAQLVENVISVSGSKQADLDATKEWRMMWWDDIIGYTVHGRYFWTGKGYGINLADDDGYQVEQDASLRSPHSIHMTLLARSGVTGIVFWAMALVVWGFGIGWAHLGARRRGYRRWAGIFLFLGCYWMAFIINGSFDVFIEGPMGGIWFWSVWGVGIACLWLYRHRGQELSHEVRRVEAYA